MNPTSTPAPKGNARAKYVFTLLERTQALHSRRARSVHGTGGGDGGRA